MATNNICITKRQLAVCINALEREAERLTKLYDATEDKEMKELVADNKGGAAEKFSDALGKGDTASAVKAFFGLRKGVIISDVLDSLKARKVSE